MMPLQPKTIKLLNTVKVKFIYFTYKLWSGHAAKTNTAKKATWPSTQQKKKVIITTNERKSLIIGQAVCIKTICKCYKETRTTATEN